MAERTPKSCQWTRGGAAAAHRSHQRTRGGAGRALLSLQREQAATEQVATEQVTDSEVFSSGEQEPGAGPGRTTAIPTRGTYTGAVTNWFLAALTLGTGIDAEELVRVQGEAMPEQP